MVAYQIVSPRSRETTAIRSEPGASVPSLLTLESDGLRYTYHVVSGSEALFEVRHDPELLRNLLSELTEDARRLRRRLEKNLGVRSLDDLRESRCQEIEDLKALGYL